MTGRREFPGEGRYVVTVPMAMVRLRGRYEHLFAGAVVPASIDPKQRDRLLKGGMIALRDDLEPELLPELLAAAPATDYESVD